MAISSYLIGSTASFADAGVTIDGSGETVSASLGGLYLYHETGTLSLLQQFEDAMTSALVASPSVDLLDSGKVKLSAGATFTVTWTDTDLRDFLGFTGNLSGASSYTADNLSPYIWVPGRTHTPTLAPQGITGAKQYDQQRTEAPDGTSVTFLAGATQRRNRVEWAYVARERYWDTEAGGEFVKFFDTVLIKGYNFFHYEYQDYSSSGTTVQNPTGGLGPYQASGDMRRVELRRSAQLETTDTSFDVEISMLVVPEYA